MMGNNTLSSSEFGIKDTGVSTSGTRYFKLFGVWYQRHRGVESNSHVSRGKLSCWSISGEMTRVKKEKDSVGMLSSDGAMGTVWNNVMKSLTT